MKRKFADDPDQYFDHTMKSNTTVFQNNNVESTDYEVFNDVRAGKYEEFDCIKINDRGVR